MFQFHAVDYVVGCLVLLVPVVIGIIFAIRDARRSTREEYLLGGRRMSLLPVGLSLFITYQSAISLIGIPSEVYTYGSKMFLLALGYCVSYFFGAVSMVPLTYPLKITSLYEYLELRYKSKAVRVICTFSALVATILYMAIALLAPALALQASAGIPLWLSVVIFGAIGTLYTVMGGIKSVIWTDAFQTVIVFIGIFAVIIVGCSEVGGLEQVWNIAEAGDRTNLGGVSLDPRERHTHLGCFVGGLFMWLGVTFNQSTMQRLSSLSSMKKAFVAYFMSVPLLAVYIGILTIEGIIVYAYYAYKRCDPLAEGLISNSNQIAPYFVLETMQYLPGMAGLYVSALSCGSLSTLSSGVNALAANTVEDILARPLSGLKESTVTLITKIIVLVYGIVIIGLAYLAKDLSGPITQLSVSVAAAMGTPVLGIFLAGALVPWANKYGATFGALVSVSFNLWLNFGQRLYGTSPVKLKPIESDSCFETSSSDWLISGTTFTTAGLANFSSPDDIYTQWYLNQTVGPHTDDAVHTRDYGFFLYDLSYEWSGLLGTLISVVFGLLGSFVTRSLPESGQTSDRRLLFIFVRKYWFGKDLGEYDLDTKPGQRELEIAPFSKSIE